MTQNKDDSENEKNLKNEEISKTEDDLKWRWELLSGWSYPSQGLTYIRGMLFCAIFLQP